MVLQFLCPNGHKVHCSESRAGQAAKCPRCGVKFRIPTPEELTGGEPVTAERTEGGSSSSALADSKASRQAAASGVASGPATGPGEIEFLCPNDHLLHGPATSQGRPGQCPICGSRFRIPNYAEATEPQASGSISVLDSASMELSAPELVGSAGGSRLESDMASPNAPQIAETQDRTTHPVAQLIARFWHLKDQGATVEIRYGEGHRLTPDEWVRSLCSPTHAVFAVREPNGTMTLTAVPWESVQLVIARGVRQLEP